MSRAAEKTLQLMLAVAYSERPKRLMDLVEETTIDKSTALRLLNTLESHALVARDDASKEYVAGSALFSLAHVLSGRFNFLELFRARLAFLRDQTGETVSFHVRAGDERTCIDGAESKQFLRRALLLSDRVPLYAGSAAKAILAFLPAEERKGVIAAAQAAGTDIEELERHLALVQKNGYLATVDDRVIGVGTISAPVFKANQVYGSVTVAGPSQRWNAEAMQAFAPMLIAETQQMSTLISVPGAVKALGQGET